MGSSCQTRLGILLLLSTACLAQESGHRIAPGPVVVQVTSSADGKPIAGVSVRLGGRSSATAPDGAATFDGVPAGAYQVVIERSGFDRFEKAVDLPAGRREPIAAVIQPTTQVRVTGLVVLEGDGRPIVGARVALVPTDVHAAVQGRFDAVTGWDGKFTIVEAPAGAYRAEASAEGCAARSIDVDVSAEHPELKLVLAQETQPASLAVAVTDSVSGGPVANAKVSLAEAWPKGLIAEGATGGAGEASFADLRLGRLNWIDDAGKVAASRPQATVRVEAEGYETTIVPVSLSAGAKVAVSVNPTAKIVEQEPNDDLASAQSIRTGAPVELAIEKPHDHDCFRFRLGEPAHVRLDLHANDALSLTLVLLQADGRERGRWSIGPREAKTFDAGPLAAGEYLLQAQEYYDVNASPAVASMRVVCEWAADPQEPNEEPSAARVLRLGEEARGCLLPSADHDFYRFEVKRPSHVRVTTTRHALSRILILANERGEELARGSVGPDGGRIDAAVPPGTHVIRVQEYYDTNTSTEPYSIRLEAIADDGSDDTAQPAGRVGVSRPLPLGAQAGATLLPPGDVDVYTVSLPSAGRLHACLVAPPDCSGTLVAMGLQGNELGRASAGPSQTTEVTWFASGPATVVLQARGYYGTESSVSPYVVRASFEPCDELEVVDRNERADEATPLDLGEDLRASLLPSGDADMYRVEVDRAGFLCVDGQSPPLSLTASVLDRSQREIARWSVGPNAAFHWEVPVLSGEHFIRLVEYYNANVHPCPYALRVSVRRAEPQEREPLREDPVRTLALGEAQAFWIDQAHDMDRFLFDMPDAGKVGLRVWGEVSVTFTVFDDRTGAQVARDSRGPRDGRRMEIEAKGPTRYRIELIEYYDTNVSPAPGCIVVDAQDRPLSADRVSAAADPCDPTRVTFTLSEATGLPRSNGGRIDADGDGRVDLDVPAGGSSEWRYAAEGLYTATAILAGADGATTRVPLWVEAIGPRERKGVHVAVDFPGDGQVVEQDSAVRVRAMSYTGERISGVSASIDGRVVATAYTAPYVIEVPWRTLGAGEHVLTLAARDSNGESKALERRFSVSEYFDLQPSDGAVVTGNQVRVSWAAGRFGPTRVRYRARGEGDWKEAVAESGADHAVLLDDLEAGKPYEFQPVGEGEPGPVRSVTRVKGLAFGRPRYGATIARDYDQRLPISVRNHGEKPIKVKLVCGKPPEESGLLVGFVGEGSEDAPLDLQPGEEREFLLGISAQDCVSPVVRFPIRTTSEGGFGDEAEVEVHVKLPTVKLEWEALGVDPSRPLAQRFRVHNRADALTDFAVVSDRPDVCISPSINHGLLPAGGSVEFVVSPSLHDGFTGVDAVLIARGVDKQFEQPYQVRLGEGERVFQIILAPGLDPADPAYEPKMRVLTERLRASASFDPGGVDWGRPDASEDADLDGRVDRWTVRKGDVCWTGDDTDGDSDVDFAHADIADDGVIEYAAFRTSKGWERTNVADAWLEIGFSLPWDASAYEKHDVDIVLNGVVIGRIRDAIPRGNYLFRIPPRAIHFGSDGRPQGNAVEIKSKHLRGGHYVVNSDFRFSIQLTATPVWTVARSIEEARKSAASVEGLSLAGADFSVSSAELRVLGPAEPSAGVDVLLEIPVRSIGSTTPHCVDVVLFEAPPGRDRVVLCRVPVEGLTAMQAAVVRLPWKTTGGVHDLRVVVDPEDIWDDLNRSDNEASISVRVAGEDAQPVVRFLDPPDGAVVKQPIVPLAAEVTDDGGAPRVEVRIDHGLWREAGASANLKAKCLLQPGAHSISIRATDSAGHQVEQAVRLRVEAEAPVATILSPAEGASIDARTTLVIVECPPAVVLAAVRVGGGPWRRATIEAGRAEVDVPLEFGQQSIEAMVVDPRGVVGRAVCSVECRSQPEETPSVSSAVAESDGVVQIEGLGRVDLFEGMNVIVVEQADPKR